jgi:release factor glutamine methyltransferase
MPKTVRALLNSGAQKLKQAGISDPFNDTKKIIAYILDVDRARLVVLDDLELNPDQFAQVEAAINARVQRKPISQIIGVRAFWGRDFFVNDHVLDPRPDTELIVEMALADDYLNVLDLGTGSGCLLATLLAENPTATGLGVDVSDGALRVAAQNIARLGVQDRGQLKHSDWFSDVRGTFDLVVSNPPYISGAAYHDLEPEVRLWEPKLALVPDESGLKAYRDIAVSLQDYLTPNGRAFLEIGYDQGNSVAEIFSSAGYVVEVVKDLSNHDRVISLRKGNAVGD